MSHVVKINTRLTDLEAVKLTCAELTKITGRKVELVQGQKTYRWYGRSVEDYPLPEGFTAEDLGHCDHVIKIDGATYDIGLARAKDGAGYVMLFDYYCQDVMLEVIGGEKANRFLQTYALNKTEREMRKIGISSLKRQVLPNGKIAVIGNSF